MKIIFKYTLLFILLAFLASLIWFGLIELIFRLKTTDSNLVASIITACATVLVGIGAVLVSHNRIKRREIDERHRGAKIELYNQFNVFLHRFLSGNNENTSIEAPSFQEMVDFMAEFKHKLLFVASPEVIKAMIAFEVNSGKGNTNILLYLDDLLVAMRKDVGLTTFALRHHELIQIFLENESKKQVRFLRK